MRQAVVVCVLLWSAIAAACVDIPPDPLQIDHGILTVDNRSSEDWKGVEIWINRYYRVTVPTIPAKSRFQVPLNAFVSGYAQRFDIKHALIKDLHLTAKQPDGKAIDLRLDDRSTLAQAVGGKK